MIFIVDENVSYSVVDSLRMLSYEVISIAEKGHSGTKDEKVYKLTVENKAVLITRDFHFTNNFRFPSKNTKGIIYIRVGNLRSDEEVSLIERFLRNYSLETISGTLVTIYRDGVKIRPPAD